MDLSPVGQELYDLLKDKNSVLSKYIQAYDYNQDDDSALRSIAERIGIYIPDEEYSAVYLYEQLKKYIENEKDPDLTRTIINDSYLGPNRLMDSIKN